MLSQNLRVQSIKSTIFLFFVIFIQSSVLFSQEPVISYERSSSKVVIEVKHANGEIAHLQQPTMKVFGNGTVEVNYPEHYTKAGTWTKSISNQELDSIILELSSSGLLKTNSEQLRALQKESEIAAKQAGNNTLYYQCSYEITEVTVNLDAYSSGRKSDRSKPLAHNVRCIGLQEKTKRFPNDTLIKLAEAEKKLVDLMNAEDLERK